MAPLVPILTAAIATLEPTIERAKQFGRNAQSANTRRAYAADRADFQAFCDRHGLSALPADPQTVALYVTHLAESGRKVATIRRHLVTIAHDHASRDLESPTRSKIVGKVMQGIARELGVAQTKKAALTSDLVRRALASTPVSAPVFGIDLQLFGSVPLDLRGLRDRALMLLGFNLAARRSELAALDVADLAFGPKGLLVTIRRSKTDQLGEGVAIGVPTHPDQAIDPVSAVRAYLDAAALVEGPVFRTFDLRGQLTMNRIDGRDVARCVQRLCAAAGVEGDMAGHSLRAGFITSAAREKIGLERIAAVSRHRNLDILRGYIRRADPFDDPIQAAIG